MLFVCLMSLRPNAKPIKERIAHRLEYSHPEGIGLFGEWWLQSSHPSVVMVFEADDMNSMQQAYAEWGDDFDINVFPAVTGEQGMQAAQSRMQSA